MSIPAHQIRNILTSYAKLLTRDETRNKGATIEIGKNARKIRFKAEAKRRMVIAKIVDEIIRKITDLYRTGQNNFSEIATAPLSGRTLGKCEYLNDAEFMYYKIGEDGIKRKFYYQVSSRGGDVHSPHPSKRI
jgi:hypothetical protein